MGDKQFEKWRPIDINTEDLYFTSLTDEYNSLKIVMSLLNLEDEGRLVFKFDTPIMYRVTPEGSRLKLTEEVPVYDGFWFTKQSELLEWFHNESADIHNDGSLIHYMICNIDNVIDIITTSNVTVSWENT